MSPDSAFPPASSEPPSWEALGRYLSGDSSAEEAQVVASYLAAHPDDARIVEAVEQAAIRLGDDLHAPIDTERALRAVMSRRTGESGDSGESGEARPVRSLEQARAARERAPSDSRVASSSPRTRWRAPAAVAAAVLLVASAALLWRGGTDSPRAAEVRFAAAVGTRDSLQLPDGTRVLLSPMSSVRYASDFGASSREVTLEGDGYFDVADNDAQPFTVHAGEAVIIDLGTAFAVQSDSARGVAVTVTEGRVRLSHSETTSSPEAPAVELVAGERAVLAIGTRTPIRDSGDVEPSLAWTRGVLVFRDALFADVSIALQRWYGVTAIADSSLRARRITATFDGDTRETVLQAIALSLGATLSLQGDSVSFRATSVGTP